MTPTPTPSPHSTTWRDIRRLYGREMKSALRERNIVIYSIVLPMVLYPGILWILFSAISFVEGQADRVTTRVMISDVPDGHAALRATMVSREDILLVEGVDDSDPLRALDRGDVDVVLDFSGDAATGTAGVTLSYDGARERSRTSRLRIERLIDHYRESVLLGSLRTAGVGDAEIQQFWLEQDNLASDRDMGGFFLGMFVPTFMIVMIGVGAMYPAIDTTAGERENSTWETLLTASISRSSIVIAKYLYVTTMSLVAGLLNLAAMSLTLGGLVGALSVDARFRVSLPITGVFVIVLGTALLALFISAGMMILASFARTFKEGQSMVGPFYVAVFLPVMFLQSPSVGLSPGLALVPLVNVALMIREAISGVYQWPLIGVTLLVELLSVMCALAFATRILRQESFVLGAGEGGLFSRFRRRRGARPNAVRGNT